MGSQDLFQCRIKPYDATTRAARRNGKAERTARVGFVGVGGGLSHGSAYGRALGI